MGTEACGSFHRLFWQCSAHLKHRDHRETGPESQEVASWGSRGKMKWLDLAIPEARAAMVISFSNLNCLPSSPPPLIFVRQELTM